MKKLIKEYNSYRKTVLIIYAAKMEMLPPNIDNSLSMEDYFDIADILHELEGESLDFFIQTPGGNGQASEEIATLLHQKFENVAFVISGEAKSAGTILALSGNEIMMTSTGSLGPIDAQERIGRSVVSAYDYIQWVNEKQDIANKSNYLNPFDSIMVAQISPGELKKIYNHLEYAKDLVKKWLPKYKFKNWTMKESSQVQVTQEMKEERAKEIAEILTNHENWRNHGRSIKIEDLEDTVRLSITKIDDDPHLADLVYSIHTIIRMIFSTTSTYKLITTEEIRLEKGAVKKDLVKPIPIKDPNDADYCCIEVSCEKCNKKYPLYARFILGPIVEESEKEFHAKGYIPFPDDDKLNCECGYEIDLSGVKNELEKSCGKRMVKDGDL